MANHYLAEIDGNGTVDRLMSSPVPEGVREELLDGLVLNLIDDRRLAALAGFLLSGFPIAGDPPLEAGWSIDSPPERARRVRDRAVEALVMRGLVAELEALAVGQQEPVPALVRYHLWTARQVAADKAQVRLTPAELLDLLARADLRLVRNSADLAQVLMDHLDELQHDLTHYSIRDIWSPDGTVLASEDDITDWVRRRLRERLGPNRILLTREPQVQRLAVKGSGTRIDLAADAPTNTAPADFASVTIEAKLFSNRELPTALRDQLVDRYLATTRQRHGIYLVYWIPVEQRNPRTKKYPDKQALLDDMRQWAADVAPQYLVSPFLLDATWPKTRS